MGILLRGRVKASQGVLDVGTFLESFILVVCASIVAVLILNPKELGFDRIQRLTVGVGVASLAFLIAYRIDRKQELWEEYKVRALNPWITTSPPPQPPDPLGFDLTQGITVAVMVTFLVIFIVRTKRKY